MVRGKLVAGAHTRYYPKDWKANKCRRTLEKERTNRITFDKVCKEYSPVFRYFFMETFLDPVMWYAAKLKYTRSVAVSSIMGHILGIGKFCRLLLRS